MTIQDNKFIGGVEKETLSLNPKKIIKLFEITRHRENVPFIRFTPHLDKYDSGVIQNIVFDGQTYIPFPVDIDGIEKNPEQQPTPKLRISNVNNVAGIHVNDMGDLLRAKVKIINTFYDQIGIENPYSLPSYEFFIAKKSEHNENFIQFDLETRLSLHNVNLPNGVMFKTYCSRRYRRYNKETGFFEYSNNTSACPYGQITLQGGLNSNRYFDKNNRPTPLAELDCCAKNVRACELRFGEGNAQPGYFFPGLRRGGRTR